MGLLTPLAVRIGAIGWMPRLLPQITAVDTALHAVTGQRIGLLDVAGLPHIVLRVAGRRSGTVRSTPLLALPVTDGWLIAGSHFGGPTMPQWVFNLRAAATAEVVAHGRAHEVVPRELDGEERREGWDRLRELWPNFDLYRERTDREIPVFLLAEVPRADGVTGPGS